MREQYQEQQIKPLQQQFAPKLRREYGFGIGI
jgi:hypothetical protein